MKNGDIFAAIRMEKTKFIILPLAVLTPSLMRTEDANQASASILFVS